MLDSYGVNYCRYNNPQSTTSQYNYAFIDDIEYVAPNTSLLHIRKDVLVSNCGSINVSECSISVRSNATKFNIDADGGIYPTNLLANVGYCEPICISSDALIGLSDYDGNYGQGWVLISCSENLDQGYHPENPIDDPTENCNGLPLSYYWYAVDPVELKLFLYHAMRNNDSAKILNMIFIPRSMVVTYSSFAYTYGAEATVDVYRVAPSSSADLYVVLGYANGYIMPTGYKPKDQNLLRYPYCFAKITDRKGHELILKPELLGTNADQDIVIDYKWESSLGDNCGIGIVVRDYMYDISADCCFSIADFPTLPSYTDAYYNYMALNKNSLTNMYLQTGVSAISSLVAKDFVGTYNQLTKFLDEDAKQADLRNYPQSVKGGSTGNIAFNSGQKGLYIELWSIPYEAAATLDKMFEQTGDSVSIVDYPRSKMLLYDVIQTVNSNVFGQIPKNEKEQIDRLYNEGITVWHISNGGIYNQYDLENNTPI